MNKCETAIESLKNGIKVYVDNEIENIKADKTYTAIIIGVYSADDNTYNIKLNGQEYDNIKSKGGIYSINDIANVKVPLGNFNNMYIESLENIQNQINEFIYLSSNFVSLDSKINGTINLYKRNNRMFLQFIGNGSITSKLDGSIIIGTVYSSYRPHIRMTNGTFINGTTNGQSYATATATIATDGTISIIVPSANTTYGNTTYPWTTDKGVFISWDI